MTTLDKSGRARFGAALLVLWLGVAVAGCSSLLDVDNPNNVIGDDLLTPAAASSVANGALYSLMAGYTYTLMCHATVSDELIWIGSRDSFQKLEQGYIDDPLNEFSDQGFREYAPARWMGDEAIEILTMHRDSGTLEDETDLARAYLYTAFVYLNIADFFDDFALSDRTLAGPPIGPANMNSMYTTAIQYATDGLTIVTGTGTDLERDLLAMRARARFALGVWNLIGTLPISPGNGLLSAGDAAAAAADAQAALNVDPSDWKFELEYEQAGAGGDAQYAINERLELRFSNDYIIPDETDKVRDRTAADRGVALQDPIDLRGDPRIDEFMTPFEDETQNSDMTLVSGRAMYLILAEDALVRNQMTEFENHINTVRAFSPTSLTAFADGGAGMPTAQQMLIHERRANLIFQGYRLNDMYRFGIQGSSWQAASPAFSAPGTQMPITKAEIDSNCHINPDWPADVECLSPGEGG
jgi:hypothetical protein